MSKNYEYIKEWRKNTKIKLVEGFGKKCGVCGLEDDPIVYDFHHLVESSKDFDLSSKILSWDKLVAEANKCVMLCSHCHRKVHAGFVKLVDPSRFDESQVRSSKNNRWGLLE